MKVPDNREEFVATLLAQDPPPPDELRQHRDLLFRRIRTRLLLYKLAVGAVYIVLFLAAFGAYLQQRGADDIAQGVLWGAVSSYILLWFLVWFLRRVYRQLAQLVHTDAAGGRDWRRRDRFITAAALVVFTLHGVVLYRCFLLADPHQAVRQATGFFWATIFFVFWYPFGMASVVAKLWLEHRKMKLRVTEFEEHDSKS